MNHPSRDDLGRRVREVWIDWAKSQPNPSPWLVPYDKLSESDREADRRIGEVLYDMGFEAGGHAVTNILTSASRETPPGMKWVNVDDHGTTGVYRLVPEDWKSTPR